MLGFRRIFSAGLGPLVVVATLLTGLAPTAAGASSSAGSCGSLPRVDPAAFPASPLLNNAYLPYVPGTRLVLDGYVTEDDGLQHPHRIDTVVTDLTKVIDGVRTLVVFDRDIEDGQLVESELFFVAQSGDGTEWLLGEYPEEYEGGTLAGAPGTWISGLDGARAGIAMLAHPEVGTPTYSQGMALSVGFFDCATVFQTGQRTCVPTRCYQDVLVTDEFSPRDVPGGHQRKYYAPGVGNIKVVPVDGTNPEFLQLTSAQKLCSSQLATIRSLALAQDSRGYEVSKTVYGKTPPAERTLTASGCGG